MLQRESVYVHMGDPELPYYTKEESNTFFVAEDKETKEIAGCVATTKISQDRMELHRLIVSPKYQVIRNKHLLLVRSTRHINLQGYGLGTRLTEAVFDHVMDKSKRGVCPKSVYLETSDAQLAAVRVYEKTGFRLEKSFTKPVGPFPYSWLMHDLKILCYIKDL